MRTIPAKAGNAALKNYHYFRTMKMPTLLDLATLDNITPRLVRQAS